jgi:putative PIN family toxin of toxin-antitoxin system
MIRAVFDANLLVSAFLSRNNPNGVSNQLLRFARRGAIELHLSTEIVSEVLVRSKRAQRLYGYTAAMAAEFCAELLSVVKIAVDPPPIAGAVPRDPDDDKIIACAVTAEAEYIVSRDRDLPSLGTYSGIPNIGPEEFLPIVRASYGRLPD